MIKCIIEDNGVGRVKTQKKEAKNEFKSSLGYNITKKRIDLNQKNDSSIDIQDVFDESGQLAGTKVVIII